MTIVSPHADGEPARLIVYALSRVDGRVDEHVSVALGALRPHAARIVAVVPAGASDEALASVTGEVDAVLRAPADAFEPAIYRWAVDRSDLRGVDQVVLTGDAWFGPLAPLGPVLQRMAGADSWGMVENAAGRPEVFPDEGYPDVAQPWPWVAIAASVARSAIWRELWEEDPSDGDALLQALARRGRNPAYAYPAADFPSEDPGLFTPTLLIEAGCPVLRRDVLTRYPPFLHRHAIVGREVLAAVAERGYPLDLVWESLVRAVPPKTVYANAALLEVLDAGPRATYDTLAPLRIAAVVHVSDMTGVGDILSRLAFLPSPYHLVMTTSDGRRATALQGMLARRPDPLRQSVDVRVTAASRGRDMSDLLVGCRDVLLGGRYDVIVKLHSRRTRRKTVNLRRYFRRYQLENLLASPRYAGALLAMFQRQPRLGIVFPPMMHIGYSTMGSGWARLRDATSALAADLGIRVPLDRVSPLAPYGGMWIGRPEALAPLAARQWRYADYRRGRDRIRRLALVQERLLSAAAGQEAYLSRTVLTREHAAISHTALEFKTDELLSTTRGWPVEQIRLLHRAGWAGHGGIVALARMYIGVNHPRLARATRPAFDAALDAVVFVKLARRGLQRLRGSMRGLDMGEDRQ